MVARLRPFADAVWLMRGERQRGPARHFELTGEWLSKKEARLLARE